MEHNGAYSAIPVGTIVMTWHHGYSGNHSVAQFPRFFKIRHTVFLLMRICVGFPLVVWALRVLRRHELSGGRVSVLVLALLLTDVLEMVLGPTILLGADMGGTGPISLLFSGVKYCALHLHQMVALEGVMARRYPPVFFLDVWRLLSLLSCLIEAIFLLLCLYVHPFAQITSVALCWLLVAAITLGATCKLTFTPTTSPSECSVSVREADHMLLAIATLGLFTLYGPFLALESALYGPLLALESAQASTPPASLERHASGILTAMTVVHPAVCLRLLVDPLLCVLVARQLPLNTQPQESTSDDN